MGGETPALVVIDMQTGFLAGDPGAFQADRVLDTVAGLQRRARERNIPVFHLQFDGPPGHPTEVGTPGWQIDPRVAALPGEPVVRKRSCDSFHRTTLDAELRRRGVSRLYITGYATELCVDTTCRRGISIGYDVTLVADAHTTVDATPSAQLDPATRIDWTNHCLSKLINEDRRIEVRPTAELAY